ncbi:hypothetical protein ACH46_01835 [Gordonia phthalatica]|uniref:DUF4333 domain-containing protein n=1 Tax=Gordonia phthalatica TaxID=1136941 RepID=A0A0N9N799_9ACTN|nr:hypothetical protein ACH46_01835 [Gordonia phthalatica]
MAGGAASIALLAGCSMTSEISQENLQKEVSAKMTPKLGQIDEVVCEGGLEAKVDATQKCKLKTSGMWREATVTATEVDGDNVKFNINVPPGTTTPPSE